MGMKEHLERMDKVFEFMVGMGGLAERLPPGTHLEAWSIVDASGVAIGNITEKGDVVIWEKKP